MYGISGSNFRLSGLATGMDTDQMVADLMRVERMPIDSLEQKKQLAEWRQTDYRDITNLLRGLKDEFFDVLNSDSYLLSDSAFKAFDATSSNTEYVTAEGLTTAVAGSHTVVVHQVATADVASSSSGISEVLQATPTDYNLSGKTINVTLDGVTRELTLDNYTDLNDLISKASTGLQDLIDTEFGSGKITVSNNGGLLQLEPTVGSGVSKITLTSGSSDDGLTLLGFTSGDSNRITTSSTLETLASEFALDTLTFDASDNLVFSINDEEFTFSKDTTLSEVMSTINNNSTANVNMTYDEVSDKITITAKQMGAGDNISITNTGGNFFDVIGINDASPVTTEGKDAQATIDGQLVTRSSNTVDVNGVQYTLLKAHDATNADDTITVTQDVDAVYETIEGFVERYNQVIDTINAKLSEEYDRDYLPLTSEQKVSMSEDEIETWENKAKKGLLRNDSMLQNIVYEFRIALTDTVENVGISLSSIGISSTSYQDKGKLYIDEDELKDAIRNTPDEVMNLFKKQSTTVPSYDRDLDSTDRSTRFEEQGLLYRLSDIIEDNISTYRNSNGQKGSLLEKAGVVGDATEFTSILYKEIYNYKEDIAELYERLYEKEDTYYQQFAKLETAMYEMNNQSNWLMSQLGMGE